MIQTSSKNIEKPVAGKPSGCPAVTVIICALNEEHNLPHVLPKIPEWVDEILLVDGHSKDGTVEVAKHLCPCIRVLGQPGRGKGNALKYGVQQALGDIIVTIDADGETPPEEIGNFVKPLLEGFDFTKGSRLTGHRPAKMPPYRWFGNKVLALTCNLLFNTRFHDVCSGYNAFWKLKFTQLDLTYGIKEVGCSMEQQMIVRAKKAGMRVLEIPHTSHGRISGASVISSKRQSIKQGFRDWFIIISERFRG
jgi:glycosyltransferase involved in cell wall biosynthesis